VMGLYGEGGGGGGVLRVNVISQLRACTGADTKVIWSVGILLRMSVVSFVITPGPPFIVPRRDLGYIYR